MYFLQEFHEEIQEEDTWGALQDENTFTLSCKKKQKNITRFRWNSLIVGSTISPYVLARGTTWF